MFVRDPIRERRDECIDYHYIYQAHEAILSWFESRDQALALHLLGCLTGPDGLAPNIRVVWYEMDANEDKVKAFVRLNVGRIALTSAELIRTVLLKSSLDTEGHDAEQIPHDWDLIERRLQDTYWYFQNGTSAPPARIKCLFDIFVRIMRREAGFFVPLSASTGRGERLLRPMTILLPGHFGEPARRVQGA